MSMGDPNTSRREAFRLEQEAATEREQRWRPAQPMGYGGGEEALERLHRLEDFVRRLTADGLELLVPEDGFVAEDDDGEMGDPARWPDRLASP